jgi:nucleotide-binding universal stress UspA family protein
MRCILVATDFSARSDRAIRRATLLARSYGSSITLVHVVDDDQPKRILEAEREAASALLSEQTRSLREIDGVTCDYRIVLGNAFEGIVKAAEEIDCDLLVLGPHRRQALKDVFIGTTAERTIRASGRPVLMANGVPAGGYRHVLLAIDFSNCSADAVRAVTRLGLGNHAAVSVVHVFEALATSLIPRASLTDAQVQDYLADVEERAGGELRAFLGNLNFDPARRVVKHNATSAADTIGKVAREVSADLVVVGTQGRTGIAKLMLGSVAEEVLRSGDSDILAVPPSEVGNDGRLGKR